MKRLSLTVLILLAAISARAQDKITWHSFEEVIQLVEDQPKMVLVSVYTDWCGWCRKMDRETFTDKHVAKYVSENFYAVKLNAENKKTTITFKGKEYNEQQMARAMQVRSYPNFVIMDAKMENITHLPGYREPEPFVTALTALLERIKD